MLNNFVWPEDLVLSQKASEGLRNGRKRSVAMNYLIKIPLQLEPADGDLFEETVTDLSLDGCPGEYGNAKTGDESLFDGCRASQLHGHIEELFLFVPFPRQ